MQYGLPYLGYMSHCHCTPQINTWFLLVICCFQLLLPSRASLYNWLLFRANVLLHTGRAQILHHKLPGTLTFRWNLCLTWSFWLIASSTSIFSQSKNTKHNNITKPIGLEKNLNVNFRLITIFEWILKFVGFVYLYSTTKDPMG